MLVSLNDSLSSAGDSKALSLSHKSRTQNGTTPNSPEGVAEFVVAVVVVVAGVGADLGLGKHTHTLSLSLSLSPR